MPKRLRYFMQRDGAVLNMVLRISLRVIAQSLQRKSPGAANVNKATLHIGAIAFIHRFGSSLNGHVHFHVCVVFGVLAPNSPLRAAVTALALAAPAQPAMAQAKPVITGEGSAGVAPQGNAVPPVPPKRARGHHLWAVLIARIYEVFPLVCPLCGGPMRIIAFITHSADVRQILEHIGVESFRFQINPRVGAKPQTVL